jgi:ureidoglycolate hydrolase
MGRIVLRCEPLTEDAFAPFGAVVHDFATVTPRLRVGTVVRNRMRAYRTAQVEWVSAHRDGEQIVVPREPVPTVFIVAPPSERLTHTQFRAFLSDGTAGVCLAPEVWHALPIPVDRDHALYDNAQGSDWHEHTVEVHLPTELGVVLCVDWG